MNFLAVDKADIASIAGQKEAVKLMSVYVSQAKPFSVSSRNWLCHRVITQRRSGRRKPLQTCVYTSATTREMRWQEIADQPSNNPLPPRSGHCLARMPVGGNTQAFIFGGYTEDEAKQRAATNDAWIFSLQQGSWSRPNMGSSQIPRAPKGDGGEILNDIWRLDLKTWTWTETSVQGEVGISLQPISRFQAAAVQNMVYIHTHRSLNDILVLDVANPDSPKLKQVPVTGNQGATPSARGLHTVTAVGNKLYLFGGASQKGQMQNDLWVLDLSTMQWTQLHPKGEAPHIRCSHTAVLMGQDIVCFGGSYYREDGSGLQPLDDTLVYSTIEDEWQKPDISGSVPRARNAAVACLLEQNKMLLHGGWEPFRNTYSDSLILHS
ncbi:MAG: hypothetical protein FRX49_04746 [Trebouxia sp. A1-2]|nr:MAG: hypothetical protein FRX49_04746 [Trebouxia sp. A1-2]